MNKRYTLAALAAAMLPGVAAQAQECQGTPFACAVDDAINRGLQYFRNMERGTGSMDGSGDAQHNFFGILSFLEKRQGVGWQGQVQGYEGMDPNDQQMVIRAISQAIAQESAMTNPNAAPYVYVTGGNLMALSTFLATGGPDDIGAAVTVSQAIANATVALQRAQGQPPQQAWDYNGPGTDLSTTQFATAGLAAAENIIEGASATLVQLTPFLQFRTMPDGGLTYRGEGDTSSSSMSATGLWCFRLAQIPAGDPSAQRPLGWLRQNYLYDSMTGGSFTPTSTFYYFWAMTKAIAVSADDGLGGAIYAESFGDRDPGALNYPEEPPSSYFDISYSLLTWQGANGDWGNGDSPDGWTQMSSHGFAVLSLERSLGGVCVDTDEDGLCGLDDNCPDLPNPDQADEDQDGVGDACDNCPKIVNRGQDDVDLDGAGDACDRYICTPDGLPEVCDGVDNDCDNLVDVLPSGEPVVAPAACATGLSGVCAAGHTECAAGGRVVCRADASPVEEVCNLIDDDCDGQIDEGTLNDCGTCGPTPGESCDGVDNNCDGDIDEGDDLCGRSETCSLGECAGPCNDGSCPVGQYCSGGLCVSLCAGTICPNGQVCDPASGLCGEPTCRGGCPDGEVCHEGECVLDNCYERGCPAGQRCVASECVADPCAGIDCGAESFCRDGNCVFSCAEIACPLGEECLDGQCQAGLCGGVLCNPGQICVEDACTDDTCDPASCPTGQTCVNGACAEDPCNGIRCPEHQVCSAVTGIAQCVADWTSEPIADAAPRPDGGIADAYIPEIDQGAGGAGGHTGDGGTGGNGQLDAGQGLDDDAGADGVTNGGGGCSCNTSGRPDYSLGLIFLAAGLPLIRRRRR